MTEQRSKVQALAWLDEMASGVWDVVNSRAPAVPGHGYHAGAAMTIKAMLAEPRMPPSPDPTWELVDTLRAMHDEQEDYSFINNLGGYNNHNMRRARAVMTKMGVPFAPDRSAKRPKRTRRILRSSWPT
jgi:hypothetical protein